MPTPNPPQRVFDYLRSLGFPYAGVAFYVSTITEQHFKNATELANSISSRAVCLPVIIPCGVFETKDLSLKSSGEDISPKLVDQIYPLDGHYLCVCIGISSLEDFDHSLRALLMQVVGALRLSFGPNVVAQEHLWAAYATDGSGLALRHSPIAGSPIGDKESDDAAGEPRLWGLHQDRRALELVGLSNASQDTAIRFTLLWTALEVAIGDGKRRRDFCEKVLGSKELSDELDRIWKEIRNPTLHEGSDRRMTAFEEFFLASMIKLKLCSVPENRQAMRDALLAHLSAKPDWPTYIFYRVRAKIRPQ